MSRRFLTTLAGLGSAGLLLAALGFQYLGALAPCPLCITQRWPHLAAVLIAVVAFIVPARVLALAGAAAAAVTSGVGAYHFGVERRWWEGPDTCVAGEIGGKSPAELLDQILAAPVVRCDEIAWEFLGVSMAGWNALASAGLVLIWLAAATRRTGVRAAS
ncbi:disulfide bond formation protein B [Rhodobacteraceae bacterium 2CG4]|uniref:Disulfide bond formation protein B n=1 Tax=Halovulum marinum TaxID=2662447 RepID=A0A6L5Z4K2_9RHOB|nr:disulfide bond formation protein B [Halovulum marinum]MSU91259.1 disulfide bond formation protein B [Halovulum marinum]